MCVITLLSGCAIQRVQTRTRTPGVQRDHPYPQEVRGEGVHPEQEGDSPQEAVARVQECYQTELCHKLGDRQLWKSGNLDCFFFISCNYFNTTKRDTCEIPEYDI